MFIVLLARIVNASNHTKRVSLSNQKYEVQPTFINLYPNEYNQEFHYYSFTVKLDKCGGSCNTLSDLSNKSMCSKQNARFKSKPVQHDYRNKWIKTLTKHVSCECKCRFDGKNIIQIDE